MDFLLFNESVKTAIRIAKALAREYSNEYYSPAHLLKGLVHKEVGLQSFLEYLNKDVVYFEEWAEVRMDDTPKAVLNGEIAGDEKVSSVFESADLIRINLGLLEINPVCVLVALAKPGVGFTADQLKSFPIRENEIMDVYLKGEVPSATGNNGGSSMPAMQFSSDSTGSMPLTSLLKYCINKTDLATDLKIRDVVKREKEVRMMVEILGRYSKPNVMIIGDSGVGKTALVDGLAKRIVDKNVPAYLEDTIIYELDSGNLIAGATYKGEIEDRLKSVIKELRTLDKAILFIDEIHTLIDPAQGNSGAANILKPEMSRGDLTIIGVTTVDSYRKLVEPDQALNRRFEVLQVEEPTAEDAEDILNYVVSVFENFHELKVTEEAIKQSVKYAKRYDKDRKLPDSAIDLIDRTMSAAKMINQTATKDILDLTKELDEIEDDKESTKEDLLKKLKFVNLVMRSRLSPILLGILSDEQDPVEIETCDEFLAYMHSCLDKLREFTKEKIESITEHEVAAVISNKTGIPIGKIQSQEKERLLNLEDILRQRVVGQDGALKSLVDAILESRSGLNKQGQPIGSFFFLGPTGTGKTELAKALAEALFNDEKAMIRFDMSEFKEEHSAALLYGAPPGYVGYEEGGLLVNKIRQQPYSVVLFDEIEKAHQSVYDIFLQIMDEGKLHDRLGKEGDFSNSIVIFTSNVGSEWLIEQLQQGKTPTTTQMMEVMSRHFRPEFLARISEIVPFSPITEDMLLQIFNIQIKSLHQALDRQGMALDIDEETSRSLSSRGFTPKYGARQIVGVIRNQLRRPISKEIINGKLNKGNKIILRSNGEELDWSIKEIEE